MIRPKWSPPSPVPIDWMIRFDLFSRLFSRIEPVEGEIVECGVGTGTTFAMLAFFAGVQNRPLRGLDSFQGFPEPTKEDCGWRNPTAGEWAVEETDVWSMLQQTGIPDRFPGFPRTLVKGFFRDTVPKEPDYRIAFLHLDVDLYESYLVCLKHLSPRVTSGGIVLFDEYREFSASHPTQEKWPGATKAVDEFFERVGTVPYRDETSGKYYVVRL